MTDPASFTPLAIARALLARGFSVIPVGLNKKPLVEWQPYQDRYATDPVLKHWFDNQNSRNVGIVCGSISGIVVVDTDDDEAEAWAVTNLPPTPMMCRTAKGMHRYYRHPGGEIRNAARINTGDARIALDVRGDGGYVVAPGSRHESGVVYTSPTRWPSLDDVPFFDPIWLATPATATTSAPTVSGTTIGEGQRNTTLTSMAGAMQRQGMTMPSIVAALQIENTSRCSPPLPTAEVGRIAASVGRYARNASTLPPLILLDDVELLNCPSPEAVVADHLFTKSLVCLWGVPGIGKTFVAQDLAFCLAWGEPWLGAPVLRSGTAIYVAAEGDSGFALRVRAWKTYHQLPLDQTLGVSTVPAAVSLLKRDEVDRLIDRIGPLAPGLVVFDTLPRCFVGGDENSAKEMGQLIDHADRIRTSLGAIVLLVHHPGKGAQSSERGSGALRGACDTMIEMTKTDDLLMVSCDKQKDASPFLPHSVVLRPVEGTGSCIVRLADSRTSTVLTETERRAVEALREGFPEGAAVGWWRKACDIPERSFLRVRVRLQQLGYIRQKRSRYFVTEKVPDAH